MGTEINEDEMPIELGDFPPYIQYIFNIYSMLPDRWEGMSGSYMGKDYGILPFLLKMEELDNIEQKDAFTFIALIDRAARRYYNEKHAQERKQREASRNRGKSIKG